MDEVSYLAKFGESSTCITMAGTPPKVPIFSRSISSSARSGSKWCIITIFPPAAVLVTMIEWQPVAWKSGTESNKAGCAFSPPDSSAGMPKRMEPAGVEEEQAHQVRAHVAVRAHRALGPPRRARRVEDGGVVLGVDGDVGGRGGLVDGAQREGEGPLGDGRRAAGRLVDGQRRLGLGAVLVGHDDGLEGRSPPRKGRMRSTRSVSTKATLEPESSRP